MHGFVLTNPRGPVSHWQSVDDPNGIGSTVGNGINDAGDLVGFHTDAAGNNRRDARYPVKDWGLLAADATVNPISEAKQRAGDPVLSC